MSFSNILGQDKAVSLLIADLKSGRIADSYLFSGPAGIGKRLTALEFAKALNCSRQEPCDRASAREWLNNVVIRKNH